MSTGTSASASSGRTLLISRILQSSPNSASGWDGLQSAPKCARTLAPPLGLLNKQKFEAVIVDLKLGEQT